jgi:hypothetical protein
VFSFDRPYYPAIKFDYHYHLCDCKESEYETTYKLYSLP